MGCFVHRVHCIGVFKSVLCFVVFLVNLNLLLYIYINIISDTPRAKPTRVVACPRRRNLIYINLRGIFG